MITKVISISIAMLFGSICFAQDKPTIPQHQPKSGAVCPRTNTDTIEYTHHKDYKAAHSRIANNQLSINLSKLFYQAYPTKAIKNNMAVVFQLAIDKRGAITDVSILRGSFNAEENAKLKELIVMATEDTWQAASYQGKTLDSECTLPLQILARIDEI
ncbi:MAG: TonB C-terminal domain-containing protein [Flavobacteriaceae bacterium]|nr:TonB C-terminal domain-containing protein [Flavobacteriaceae bacterium]